MIHIDKDACIGCGLCVKDCIAKNITLSDGHAEPYFDCFLCGHCVAICPQNAITIEEYDMDDVKPYVPEAFQLSPEILLSAIKYRRSIRHYTPEPVSEAAIDRLVQAGRYTATAKNTQGCRFIIVQEQLDTLKSLIWGHIGKAIEAANNTETFPPQLEDYRRFYRDHKRHPENDYLFRNAPAVVIICAQNPVDAALAAQNMELMAVSLGLGVLYNGYLNRAIIDSPECLEWLETTDQPPQVTMLLGHPAVHYARTAPRRKVDVIRR